MVTTTIQVSQELKQELDKRKFSKNETYEEIVWDLMEDTMELSEETKKEIEEARKNIRKGRFYTLSQVKRKLGL